MLSEPAKFTEAYSRKARRKEVPSFRTIVELLRISGLGYLYVFLDQFEELFHGRRAKDVLALALGMRQVLEACAGLATFVVTLHPSAAMGLRSLDGRNLTAIAPVY